MSRTEPNPAHTWAGKVVKESGIGFAGSLLGTALNYGVLVVMTRFLAPDELGLFTLGQSVLAVALIVVLLGTPRALDRFIPYYMAAREYGRVRSVIRFVILLAAAISAVVMLSLAAGAGWFSRDIFKTEGLAPVLRLMLFAVPMLAWIEIVSASFTGFKELRYRVYTHQIALPTLKLGIALALFSLGYGLGGWLWAYLVSLVVTGGYALWLFWKHIASRLRGVAPGAINLREIVSYSWPLSVSNFMVVFAANLSVLLLGYYQSAAEVGVYRVYAYMILIMTLSDNSFVRIYKPLASGFISSKSDAAGEELYKRVAKWMLTVGGYIGLIMVFLGRDIVSLLFPQGYQVVAVALVVLVLGRLVVCACGPQGAALEAFASTRISMGNAILMLGLNLVLGLLLIPRFGVLGAALSTSLAVSGTAISGMVAMKLVHGILPFGDGYFRTLAALSVVAFPLWYLTRAAKMLSAWPLMGVALALGAVYVLALWRFGALDSVDREVAKRIWHRARGFARR